MIFKAGNPDLRNGTKGAWLQRERRKGEEKYLLLIFNWHYKPGERE